MVSSGQLANARARTEALMQTTCKIGSTRTTTDPDTLDPVNVLDQIVYDGPCRVRFDSGANNTVDAGGQDVAVQGLVLSLPVDSSGAVHTGHTVQITANPYDSGLVGTQFRVAGYHAQTYATARRFPIEVIS